MKLINQLSQQQSPSARLYPGNNLSKSYFLQIELTWENKPILTMEAQKLEGD